MLLPSFISCSLSYPANRSLFPVTLEVIYCCHSIGLLLLLAELISWFFPLPMSSPKNSPDTNKADALISFQVAYLPECISLISERNLLKLDVLSFEHIHPTVPIKVGTGLLLLHFLQIFAFIKTQMLICLALYKYSAHNIYNE